MEVVLDVAKKVTSNVSAQKHPLVEQTVFQLVLGPTFTEQT